MLVRLQVVRGRRMPEELTFEAETPEQAHALATDQGYTVLRAERAVPPSGALSSRSRGTGFRVTLLIEQMLALLAAGLSLIEVVETLRLSAPLAWRPVLDQLTLKLRQGRQLSDALSKLPDAPPLLIALVKSSEVTSNLPQALSRYLENERRAEQVRHQLVSVALYPALLLGVGGSVLLFLLIYVMPRFARIFEGMQGQLPWSAQAMVGWAHLLRDHALPLGIGLGGCLALVVSVLLAPGYRAAVLARMLAWPAAAHRIRLHFLARWYRTTGMLVKGGIPLPESLQMSAQVLPLGLRQQGLAVEELMRQGHAPSHAYDGAAMATPVALQLVAAGERSGDVGTMLERAAEFHETEVARSLENLMRVLEPLVMVLIGLGVGVVVVLMYLPIFELASAIQ